ncbi:MAG: hypothetical protein EZS28_011676 [Streblomastix strix]|uniref:Uncharacterized protein n=1 Tax=Streblomastix strix TaxID=222440 RepID=A0A5J4WEI7_9EUKA|nr:MAG: hypothetical protein EZS28_011676 [Streblomastix strix]
MKKCDDVQKKLSWVINQNDQIIVIACSTGTSFTQSDLYSGALSRKITSSESSFVFQLIFFVKSGIFLFCADKAVHIAKLKKGLLNADYNWFGVMLPQDGT